MSHVVVKTFPSVEPDTSLGWVQGRRNNWMRCDTAAPVTCAHWFYGTWAKKTVMEDVDLEMCLWLMNNLVSEDVSLHFTVWLRVCVWIWQKQRACVCVCVCSRALACVYVGGLAFWPRRGSPTAFGRGANWRGAPPPRRVLSEHEGRWINKSWGSKFCHMSGHVFPSSSWEQRPPARPTHSLLTAPLGPCPC